MKESVKSSDNPSTTFCCVSESAKSILCIEHYRVFITDFILDPHKRMQERVGAGRAAGNIGVHGQEIITPLNNAIAAVHASRRGTGPHGNTPFGVRHLIPNSPDGMRHFIIYPSGNNHYITLPGRETHHFRAETRSEEHTSE